MVLVSCTTLGFPCTPVKVRVRVRVRVRYKIGVKVKVGQVYLR